MENEAATIRQIAEKHGQRHLFTFWESLTLDEKKIFLHDLKEINFEKVLDFYKACNERNKNVDDDLEPLNEEVCGSVTEATKNGTLTALENRGLQAVADGEVGVLLMAGGQGTRLGVTYPKGMYKVGVPSDKTLYQLQAERIQRVKELARQQCGKEKAASLPWYIMTSEHTKAPTEEFFGNNDYFGLGKENVVFFEQYTLPAVTFDEKILLNTTHSLAMSPDGNGGLYRAIREQDILQDMKNRGVRFVHVYGVDNILVRMADPRFLGFCLSKDAECGAKVVEKISKEAMGVVGMVKKRYQVVEYSEISEEKGSRKLADGRLVFRSGNICNHFFTVAFLDKICAAEFEEQLVYHLANKKVPTVNLETGERYTPIEPNAVKMEKFVFDVFPYAERMAVWEVLRQDEFSPLKNAPGAGKDCPETCKGDLLSRHRCLLEAAGAVFPSASNPEGGDGAVTDVELSPLVSYDGEGLESIVHGKKFTGGSVSIERKPDGTVEFITAKSPNDANL